MCEKKDEVNSDVVKILWCKEHTHTKEYLMFVYNLFGNDQSASEIFNNVQSSVNITYNLINENKVKENSKTNLLNNVVRYYTYLHLLYITILSD